MHFLKMLFFADGLIPQDSCYLWNPGVICLQGIPAFLIALAYLFIPATVSYFGYRRRGLALNWMFLCCGIFILACGATYATEVWTLWHATYWLSGAITAITAMAALPTAVLLVRLVPGALALPTPEAMRLEFADHGRVEESLLDQQRTLVGFTEITRDLTDCRRAEEALQSTRAELARVARMTTVGEFTVLLAHELDQWLSAIVNNAYASRRLLDRQPPALEEVRQAVVEIAEAGTSAGELISRIRALVKKSVQDKSSLDMNQIIQEVLALIPGELQKHHVSVRMELLPVLPPVLGDRVQLQQVVLHLILNGIDAMNSVLDRPRILLVRSRTQETEDLLVVIEDSGTGLDPRNVDRLFDNFFTTKTHGLGMGLPIRRSIIEAHNGRLWASQNNTHGATFQFTIPALH